MMKITLVLFVVALAYTAAKAVDDDASMLLDKSDFNTDSGFSSLSSGFPDMKMPSIDDIENLKPKEAGEHVSGSYQSSSSSKKTVNGKVVEDKHEGESAVNDNGKVEKSSYHS